MKSLQGEFPPVRKKGWQRRTQEEYDSDNEHYPHALLQNISRVERERVVSGELQLLCEFHQAGSENESVEGTVNQSKVIRELLQCQVHIKVPSKTGYWFTPKSGHYMTHESLYGELEGHVLRVQNQRSDGKLDCVIVEGPVPENIGREIKGGLSYGGQFGIKSMIKGLQL